MELPKATLQLTGEELYQIIGALSSCAQMLGQMDTSAFRHRAEHYKLLRDKIDTAYAVLHRRPDWK